MNGGHNQNDSLEAILARAQRAQEALRQLELEIAAHVAHLDNMLAEIENETEE